MRPLARVSIYYVVAIAALFTYSLAFADGVAPVVAETWLSRLDDWMKAGTPPHWAWLAIALVYFDLKVMPKTKWKSNSLVEVIFNPLNKILLPILGKVPGVGEILAALDTPESSAALAATTPVSTTPPEPPTQLPPVIKAAGFLPFLLAGGLLVSGCAHGPIPPPVTPISTQQYQAAFGACMAAAGISDATGIGEKVLQILETPGLTQTQITNQIEALGIGAAGDLVKHTAICAVQAWSAVHPVAAGTKPTAAQGAVRVFQARHMPAPVAPGVHN